MLVLEIDKHNLYLQKSLLAKVNYKFCTKTGR